MKFEDKPTLAQTGELDGLMVAGVLALIILAIFFGVIVL